MQWIAGGARRLAVAAIVLGGAVSLATSAASAAGSQFGITEVVEEVQRQLTAADQGDSPLHIDDASLELTLVEGAGTKAGGLAVPGADFDATGKVDGQRPSLKRRLVLDLAAAKGARTAGSGASGAGAGKLTAAIQEVRASVQQAMAAGAFDLKRLSLDFDFAVERDGKGQPSLIVYARDRKIDAPDVQGIKVRFSAKDK